MEFSRDFQSLKKVEKMVARTRWLLMSVLLLLLSSQGDCVVDYFGGFNSLVHSEGKGGHAEESKRKCEMESNTEKE